MITLKNLLGTSLLSLSIAGCSGGEQSPLITQTEVNEKTQENSQIEVKYLVKEFRQVFQPGVPSSVESACPSGWFATGGGHQFTDGHKRIVIWEQSIVGPWAPPKAKNMIYRLSFTNETGGPVRVSGTVSVSCLNPASLK
jgi:hypothetical protein